MCSTYTSNRAYWIHFFQARGPLLRGDVLECNRWTTGKRWTAVDSADVMRATSQACCIPQEKTPPVIGECFQLDFYCLSISLAGRRENRWIVKIFENILRIRTKADFAEERRVFIYLCWRVTHISWFTLPACPLLGVISQADLDKAFPDSPRKQSPAIFNGDNFTCSVDTPFLLFAGVSTHSKPNLTTKFNNRSVPHVSGERTHWACIWNILREWEVDCLGLWPPETVRTNCHQSMLFE